MSDTLWFASGRLGSARVGRLLWLIVGLLLCSAGLGAAEDLRAGIRRDAARCAAAWQREDYAAIVSSMPPRVVQQLGGRTALTAELKGYFAEARKWGAERIEILPGQPSTPKPTGRWLTSLLPVTAVVHGAHAQLTQDTHVLALSSDQGKRWSFVPLYDVTAAELHTWFPEFKGKLAPPPTPTPRVKLVF